MKENKDLIDNLNKILYINKVNIYFNRNYNKELY